MYKEKVCENFVYKNLSKVWNMKKKVIYMFIIASGLCLGTFCSCGHDVQKSETDLKGGLPVAAVTTEASDSDTKNNDTDPTVSTSDKSDADPDKTTQTTAATDSKGYVAGVDGAHGTKPNSTGGTSTGGSGGSGGSSKPTGITLSFNSVELIVGQTKMPMVSETISEVWTSSDTKVAVVDNLGNITAVGEGSCVIRVVSESDSKLGAEVKVTVKKSDGLQVIDGISYKNGILIANKSYALPATYNPGGLTNDTYSAFLELVAGAANDGLNIYNSSGFRSYDYQSQIYNNYVEIYGQESADTFSARPGYSEHQTGMAIDCNIIDDTFIGTPEANWLEEHCTEYGFIIRYPQGKQDVTGYKYEPWHIRYIGKENASAFKDAANAACDRYYTLEEWLGIDSYYH